MKKETISLILNEKEIADLKYIMSQENLRNRSECIRKLIKDRKQSYEGVVSCQN